MNRHDVRRLHTYRPFKRRSKYVTVAFMHRLRERTDIYRHRMRCQVSAFFAVTSLAAVFPGFVLGAEDEQVSLGMPFGHKRAPLPVSHPTVPLWSAHPEDNLLAKEGSDGPLTHDADVCIIGTGTTGVSAAYHVARSVADKPISDDPLKIVLLEARDFCAFLSRLALLPVLARLTVCDDRLRRNW